MINRGPITDRLVAELKTAGLPVGDNRAPLDPYGWQGEPDSENSSFIPWMTISAGTGRTQARPGSLGDSSSEWNLSYTVTYAAVTRDQLDWLADKMRLVLTGVQRDAVTTESGRWRFQQIRCNTVGGTNRITSAFPDYYTQADLFEVWLSKERS